MDPVVDLPVPRERLVRMNEATQFPIDEGFIELSGSPPISIWVQTCPNTRCGCRSALVLAARRGREALLASAAVVRAAWDAARRFSDVAPQLVDIDAFQIDIDSAQVTAPADDHAVDLARVGDVVARMDGETLDAIAHLWIRGKGWPDPEQRLRDAHQVVLRGWRPGDLVAYPACSSTRYSCANDLREATIAASSCAAG